MEIVLKWKFLEYKVDSFSVYFIGGIVWFVGLVTRMRLFMEMYANTLEGNWTFAMQPKNMN